MRQCPSCEGFVPEGRAACPNCKSTWKGLLTFTLAAAGAGVAAVTLSACYGPGCATRLPDGTLDYPGSTCVGFDCTLPLADGGVRTNDPQWAQRCVCYQRQADGGQGQNDPAFKHICQGDPLPQDAGTGTGDGGTDAGH